MSPVQNWSFAYDPDHNGHCAACGEKTEQGRGPGGKRTLVHYASASNNRTWYYCKREHLIAWEKIVTEEDDW